MSIQFGNPHIIHCDHCEKIIEVHKFQERHCYRMKQIAVLPRLKEHALEEGWIVRGTSTYCSEDCQEASNAALERERALLKAEREANKHLPPLVTPAPFPELDLSALYSIDYDILD